MLQVDIEDVLAVLDLCVPYLVVIGVAVVAMLVAMVAVRKHPKPKRFLVRAQAAIACVLVVAISVNLLCLGPLATLIGLATSPALTVSDETTERAKELTEKITGGVLLNQKMAPTMLASERNKQKLEMLISTFFDRLHGYHVQYNIVSRETLLDAQARQGNRSAAAALKLTKDPNCFLSTIQVGITVISILTGIFSSNEFAVSFGELLATLGIGSNYAYLAAQAIIVVVVTYLSCELGELVPKRIGLGRAEAMAKFTAPAMLLFFYKGEKEKAEKAARERRDSVIRDLPSFNSQILLLLGSGLIFEEAFAKVAGGYGEKSERSYFENMVVEMSRKCRETNISAAKAMDIYSAKIGVREFSRIKGIIVTAGYKGTDLSEKLADEGELLWNNRKKTAEERGKIAETKLSVPLALLLLALIGVTAAPAMMQM